MMEMEAGWYRDPAPADPAAPTTVRFWDGRQWTTQVKQASRQQRSEWRVEELARQREYAASVQAAGGAGYAGGYGAVGRLSERDVTPDGAPLAGWWQRVGAVLVDGLITGMVGLLVGWHFVGELAASSMAGMTALQEASRTGSTASPDLFMGRFASAYLGLLVVVVLVRFVYDVGFLKAFAATPGKMVLGLEVRLRERPGPLSWGTVLARWFTANLGSLLSLLPVVALFAWVYSLLDVLWPLWDPKRQAVHDKVARTNVACTR